MAHKLAKWADSISLFGFLSLELIPVAVVSVDSAMGNCLTSLPSPTAKNFSKKSKALPIETMFKLPSPLPVWPKGDGFASGTIDLGGGLRVCQVSTMVKVWATHEGGPDNTGATFFEPSHIPDGFYMLGCYSQPNNKPFFGWVLAGKDDGSSEALRKPLDYTLIWSSESSKIKEDGHGYVWLPIPPDGYKAIGHVVTNSPQKPSPEKIRCVRANLTDQCEAGSWIWGPGQASDANGFNVYTVKPSIRGIKALGVSVGTFVAQIDGTVSPLSLACLKNAQANLSCMPNQTQIDALIRAYSPWVYLHPDEEYLPSSVSWFFANGTLLYKKGEETKPVPIEPNGSSLPQGGSNDGAYWAKVKIVNVPLGKIGEHVGDWEHVTLRVSNFNGELQRMYFSEHSGGTWVEASELVSKWTCFAREWGIGIRNDTEKSKMVMDTGVSYSLVAAEYLGSAINEPAWLNYCREWGPKLSYDITDEIKKVEKALPGPVRSAFEKFVKGLPNEVLGEEGPTGPKMKNNWSGDER
ncbi:hypothetical protein CJ030_MR1G007277 [Morella rubra]|uniref:Vacuolar protein sorting-associated protein 62 n=1 Tax=Morella rubra TaxID=262757 RepID=A0A6A1WME7_9ROSI|nr:hypothetical protein CJ030_MR1G007277 [Morella rubra]